MVTCGKPNGGLRLSASHDITHPFDFLLYVYHFSVPGGAAGVWTDLGACLAKTEPTAAGHAAPNVNASPAVTAAPQVKASPAVNATHPAASAKAAPEAKSSPEVVGAKFRF